MLNKLNGFAFELACAGLCIAHMPCWAFRRHKLMNTVECMLGLHALCKFFFAKVEDHHRVAGVFDCI